MIKKILLFIFLSSIKTSVAAEISSGICSQKGTIRKQNEDAYIICSSGKGRYLSGVFDGHYGDGVSQFLKNNIKQVFDEDKSLDIKTKLENTFLTLDQKVSHLNAGSSAAVAYLVTKKKKNRNTLILHTAHVGDCRIILIDKNGIPVFSTKDHKVNRKCERIRINNNGGMIYSQEIKKPNKNIREEFVIVQGYKLGVSRVIGDRFLDKEKKLIIANPECHQLKLRGFYYLVICSNGLSDGLTNADIGSFIINNKEQALSLLTRLLAEKAVEKGSMDDITVIIDRIKTE